MARNTLLIVWFALSIIFIPAARAQFDILYGQDQTVIRDTSNAAVDTTLTAPSTDADSLVKDSVETDSVSIDTTEYIEQENVQPKDAKPDETLYKEALLWLKRLLFRGTFDARSIGAYARYQLTAWNEALGSSGAIQARLSVYYLGTTEWMGRDAEWMQAVYEVPGQEPGKVEFDLVLPQSAEIREIFRIVYRIDDGDLKSTELKPDPNALDYDAEDRPESEGSEDVRLFSGMYETEKFRGAGSDGATVIIYKSKSVPPMGVVKLGYGNLGLTLTDKGLDGSQRFEVPPPPAVRSR
jgi:hypothetical protein